MNIRSVDHRDLHIPADTVFFAELINVSGSTDQHDVLKHAALAVLKPCDFFARANGGPDNRLPFIQRVSWSFSAEHRAGLFGSALLFPEGGDIVVCALLGMEDVYDNILEIDKDPAVA